MTILPRDKSMPIHLVRPPGSLVVYHDAADLVCVLDHGRISPQNLRRLLMRAGYQVSPPPEPPAPADTPVAGSK